MMTMVTTIIIVPEPGHVISEQLRDVGLKITLTLQVGMLRLREFRTRAQSTQAMKPERGFKRTAVGPQSSLSFCTFTALPGCGPWIKG